MHQDIDEIRENVAFMRQIVTEARESALGDGLGFIAAGLLFGVAGVAGFAISALHLTVPGGINGLFGLAIVLFLVQAMARRGRFRVEASNAGAARIARLARLGLILTLVTLLLSFYLYGRGRTTLMPMAPVVVFSIYGGAWFAVIGLTSATWPRWIAGLSYVAALVLALLAETHWQLLGFGLAMFALALAPGLIIRHNAYRRWPD